MLPSVEVNVCHQPNCVVPLKFWSLVEVTLPLLRIKLPLKVTVFPFTAEVIVVSPLKTRALIAVTAEFTFAVPLKVTVVAVNVRFSLKIAELSKVMFSLALTFLQPSVTVSLKVMFPSVDLTSAPTVASPVKAISFTAVTAPFTFAVPPKAISVLALTLPVEFTVAAASKLTLAPVDVTAALKSAVPSNSIAPPALTAASTSAVPAKLTAPSAVTAAPELIAAFPLK